MNDDVWNEIFDQGENLLEQGASIPAVLCFRGVMETLYRAFGYFPDVEFTNLRTLDLTWKHKNTDTLLRICDDGRIVGWSCSEGVTADGKTYCDPGEFWHRNLAEFQERWERRINSRRFQRHIAID